MNFLEGDLTIVSTKESSCHFSEEFTAQTVIPQVCGTKLSLLPVRQNLSRGKQA